MIQHRHEPRRGGMITMYAECETDKGLVAISGRHPIEIVFKSERRKRIREEYYKSLLVFIADEGATCTY